MNGSNEWTVHSPEWKVDSGEKKVEAGEKKVEAAEAFIASESRRGYLAFFLSALVLAPLRPMAP